MRLIVRLYDLLLYGARATNGESQTYTLESGTATTGDAIQVRSSDAGNATTASWTGISVTASTTINSTTYNNAIVVDMGVASNGGMLNYASLTAVPEPSAICLVGCAAAGLVVRRRRSR